MAQAVRIKQQRGRAYSVPAVLAGALITILALFVLTPRLTYAGRIYPGVTAYGIDLGGKTVEQATRDLQSRLDAFGHQRIVVQAGDEQLDLTPTDLGYRPRPAEIARASYEIGRDGPPLVSLAGPWLAARLLPPAGSGANVDEDALAHAVDRIAARVDRPAREPALVIGSAIALQPGRAGMKLDRARTRDQIREYLSTLSSGPLRLPVHVVAPRLSDATVEQLGNRAREIVGQPLVVRATDRQWIVPPSQLRTALRYQSSPPALTVDRHAFDQIVSDIAAQIDRSPRDASLTIIDGRVSVIADRTGASVDRSATLDVLTRSILDGRHQADVVIAERFPAVRADDLRALAQQTQHLLDQGVTLEAGDFQYRLAGARLGDLIDVSPEQGRPGLSLNRSKLAQTIANLNQQFRRPTPRTRFTWKDGKVSFAGPSREGWIVDEEAAIQAVTAHWQEGTVELPVVTSPTALDDSYLARLQQDLTGVIEERATSFAGSIPERAHNIALAAQRLSGVVVSPGEVFSFNQAVGPTRLQDGYQWGFAFSTDSNGQSQTIPAVAGGLCQVASTVFQPVFWAGYEIEERHNHMFWMRLYKDRGYLGLDATVSPADGVDLKFKNDSPHALLIQSWTEGEQIHVQLIGTRPDWQVQVDPERITDVVPAPTRVLRTTSPLFQKGRVIVLEEAQTGLTSHVTRRVIYPDGHVRTLNLESVYQPANAAVLVGTG